MTSTDHDRHHLARELHDGVTQYVLAAGFALDLDDQTFTAIGVGAATIVAVLLAHGAWIARKASRPALEGAA